jgi:multidrug efflux pump subunit AcrA (membrane-fusion protein)
VTFDRYQKLSTLQNVSQADLDKVRTTWQSSEQSVSSLNANIRNLRIQRASGMSTATLRCKNTVMRWMKPS